MKNLIEDLTTAAANKDLDVEEGLRLVARALEALPRTKQAAWLYPHWSPLYTDDGLKTLWRAIWPGLVADFIENLGEEATAAGVTHSTLPSVLRDMAQELGEATATSTSAEGAPHGVASLSGEIEPRTCDICGEPADGWNAYKPEAHRVAHGDDPHPFLPLVAGHRAAGPAHWTEAPHKTCVSRAIDMRPAAHQHRVSVGDAAAWCERALEVLSTERNARTASDESATFVYQLAQAIRRTRYIMQARGKRPPISLHALRDSHGDEYGSVRVAAGGTLEIGLNRMPPGGVLRLEPLAYSPAWS